METAIYARYSDVSQSETSIDDQVRRAEEVAKKLGLTVSEGHIYKDIAISGKKDSVSKRDGLAKLVEAMKAGEVRCVVVDELTRLHRGMRNLINFVEDAKSMGVRVLSFQLSFDSLSSHSHFLLGIMAMFAEDEVRGTSDRTKRGMLGALERKGMVGAPPMGYNLIPDTEKGKGAQWVINKETAALVVEMFEARKNGASLMSIAKSLQDRGIPTPRPGDKGGRYWRPASVRQILSRTIYKGVFVWNGSSFTLAKAKKTGIRPEQIEFQRPELRLVSDELWQVANPAPNTAPRSTRKHSLRGVLRCGICFSKLTIKHSECGGYPNAYCATCEDEGRVKGKRRTGRYLMIEPLADVIQQVVLQFFNADEFNAYADQLRALNSGDKQQQVQTIEERMSKVKKDLDGFHRYIQKFPDFYQNVEESMSKLAQEQRTLDASLKKLETQNSLVSCKLIEEHLRQVSELSENVTRDNILNTSSPAEVNKVLVKLFPRFLLYPGEVEGERIVEVTFNPAASLLGEYDETNARTYRFILTKKMTPRRHYAVEEI